jgi:hypothetical protein
LRAALIASRAQSSSCDALARKEGIVFLDGTVTEGEGLRVALGNALPKMARRRKANSSAKGK